MFETEKHGLILVVDDNEFVVDTVSANLRHAGYRVVTASRGTEAVRLFSERPNAFLVVVLDVIMPDLDGPETLFALQKIDPHVSVVFMTGYTGEFSDRILLAIGAFSVLMKPFSPKELIALIQDLEAKKAAKMNRQATNFTSADSANSDETPIVRAGSCWDN